MVLPILVPPEAAALRPDARWTRLPQRRAPSRAMRQAEHARGRPDDRDGLLLGWRGLLHRPRSPVMRSKAVSSGLRATGSAPSDPVELFDDCVRLLRTVQRRGRRHLPQCSRSALPMIMRSFSPHTSSVRASLGDIDAVAWVLASMHWCGCRHPAALLCEPTHAPTGLVRWMSRFNVQEQTDRPHDVLRQFAEELKSVARQSLRIVASMRSCSVRERGAFVILPELLR